MKKTSDMDVEVAGAVALADAAAVGVMMDQKREIVVPLDVAHTRSMSDLSSS